jgi:hypothetical protein
VPTVPTPPPSGANVSFYKAVNLNGGSTALSGKTFQAGNTLRSFTASGKSVCASATPKPAASSDLSKIVKCGVGGSMLATTLDGVPNGTYQVYLYVTQPTNTTSTFNLTLERRVVVPSYTMSGAGTWNKLGPFTATVTDRTIDVGSWMGNVPALSAIEVHKVG